VYSEPATAELNVDDQRKLLYEDYNIKSRWEQYSAQITTLAGHLRLLLKNESNLFRAQGEGSVQERVSGNTLTGKLYLYLLDYKSQSDEDYTQLYAKFKFTILSDEYVILRAMDADVQEIEDNGLRASICSDYEEWAAFLSKILPNVTDEVELSGMKLGSELHTFPADASLDLMQHLTRRLEALQDW